jgi:hypothetical protein
MPPTTQQPLSAGQLRMLLRHILTIKLEHSAEISLLGKSLLRSDMFGSAHRLVNAH